jgi:hypothetical protein
VQSNKVCTDLIEFEKNINYAMCALSNGFTDKMTLTSNAGGWTCLGGTPSTPVCSWTGVTCDLSGSVEKIYIADKNIQGTIASEVGKLTGLTELFLNANSFIGTVPSEVGQLTGLRLLYLRANSFSGSLPWELSLLSELTNLHVDYNYNLGPGLPCLPASVTTLYYSYDTSIDCSYPPPDGDTSACRSTGVSATVCSSFPCADGYMQSGNECVTEQLATQNTAMCALASGFTSNTGLATGWECINGAPILSLCTWTGVVCVRGLVTRIDVGNKGIVGTVATELGLLSLLRSINFYNNFLSGTMPQQIAFLSLMIDLSLQSNSFSGAIPTEIGLLNSITRLELSDNIISGSLPIQIGNLFNLSHLSFHSNLISGSLPSDLGLLTNLQKIHLSNNNK